MKGWKASDIAKKQQGGTIAGTGGRAAKATRPQGKPKAAVKEPEQGFIPFQGETFRKGRKKPSYEETILHINCVKLMQLFYPKEWEDCYHYPAEEEDPAKRRQNARKDVKGGWWDYVVLIERHGFQGMFIEFKRKTGLSPSQKAFRKRHRHRFVFAVVKLEERFLAVMGWYLGPSKVKSNLWAQPPPR